MSKALEEKLEYIGDSMSKIAQAIRPDGLGLGEGVGGKIDSLMEAQMDVAYALNEIAKAIVHLADTLDRKMEDQ